VIAGLVALEANPDMTRDHVTLFTGGGYGLVYYRRWIPASTEVNWAVMDKMRFEGTCLVEIWSVSQRIFGNETNPIAFF
jgi:predicted SnoaL-like aldol condensation-catalyzing enzyme